MLKDVKPHLLCEVHDAAMIERIQGFLGCFGYSTKHWQPVLLRYPDYKQRFIWGTCERESREGN